VVNHDRDRDPVVVHDDDDRMVRDPDVRRRIVQEELVRHGVVQPRQFGNIPATAGLTLGVAAVVVGWVPALFAFAGLFGVVGLVMSIAGRRRAALDERTGRGRAMAGTLFSLLGIAMAVVGFLVMADVINTFDGTIADVLDELRDVDTDMSDSLGS
ncbi:MAG: DUF4190 domain-containing protein, partial [Actinomycetota bacterium]